MKMFEYDPVAGVRGKFVGFRPVASWTDCSLKFMARNGHKVPDCVVRICPGAEWEAHVDAGVERSFADRGKHPEFVSYRDETRWLCFCIGEFKAGFGKGMWQWVIIPPTKGVDLGENYISYDTWRRDYE